MSTGQIIVKLELDDSNFRGSITGASVDLRRFERVIRSSDTAVRSSEHRHRSWARTLRDSVIVLGLARNAIQNLSSVMFALPSAVIKSNAELERLEALMIGLSTETGGFAAAQADAAKNMDFLFDAAKRGPFDVNSL